jgi:hypothetical protein
MPSPDVPVPVPVTDPNLVHILGAWPTLPDHIRAAVLALVQTAR